jgi:PKD repeat protein
MTLCVLRGSFVLLILLLASCSVTATASEPYDFSGSWPVGDAGALISGVATGPNGDLYVTAAEPPSRAAILRYTRDGRLVQEIEIPVNGTWKASHAMDVAVNRSGFIFLTNPMGGPEGRGAVYIFSPGGDLVHFFRPWAAADNGLIYGIGIGPDDHVFVTDYNTNMVQEFSAGGRRVAVYGGEEGTGRGQFSMPVDVAVAPDGTCYVSNFAVDGPNGRRGYITRFVPGGEWTGWAFDGDWALLNCIDARGRLAVTNFVRFGTAVNRTHGVNPDHGVYLYSPDGSLCSAFGSRGDNDGQFLRPMGTAANRGGSVYVVDPILRAVSAWSPYTAPAGPLSASFAISPQSGIAPLTVRFLDYSTGAVAWSWDFGDGTNSSEHAPIHTYMRAGRYTVSLTTTDAAGGTGTGVRYDAVVATAPGPTPAPTPEGLFGSNTSKGPAPLAVAFTDESTGEPYGWLWEFGDGATSLEQHPVHTYTAPGRYLVNLTIFTPMGIARNENPRYVEVGPDLGAPVANFTMSRSGGTAPLYVKFTDCSTGAPSSWRWDFGGLTWTAARNPVVVFRQAGTYPVTLTARNEYGTSAMTKNVTVTGGLPMSGKGDAIRVVG